MRGGGKEKGESYGVRIGAHIQKGFEPLSRAKRAIIKRINYGMSNMCNGFADNKNTGLGLYLLR